MHAMQGGHTPKYTFTLSVKIGDVTASALVDSGSTTTFMNPKFATLAKCTLIPSKKLRVTVANGGYLWTEFSCVDCQYDIQGVTFASDFRILQVKGYDLILGADWIYQHSPVELDYKKMTLQVTASQGNTAKFYDDSLPSSANYLTV